MYAAHQDTDPINSPLPLTVAKISLTAFRNYAACRLLTTAAPVVLTGANGSGKTNLLEAISLLVPGRGMRRAALHDLQNRTRAEAWAVAVELETGSGPLQIGTGHDSQKDDGERRVIHIEGRNVRGQSALADHVAMAWITPDMDRTLAEGPSARRKLLDRLVYSFDPAHNGRITRYEKALRERLRLLRDGPADAAWLSALEDELAKTGVAIAAARKHMLRQLRTAIAESDSVFPRADLALKGTAEEALDDHPALLVEDKMREALARLRGEDAQTGTCGIGPHRSDLLVTHREKNCPADLCSTGEQKALLIAIMLSYLRTLIHARGMTPLFLLDDIAAHLDDTRRRALFDEILTLRVQAWVTGTDQDAFSQILRASQHFRIEHGVIYN